MLKNAIVVMFDSLQYNYLGCYGNTWIKTPNFDRFAREGALFENCYTEGLPTVPCRRAMHTGRYTLQKSGWVAISMEDTTIADLTWGRPIEAALVFDCPMYRLMKFGYTRGFDHVKFIRGHEGDTGYFHNVPIIDDNASNYLEDHIRDHADKVLGEKVIDPLVHELEDYLRQTQYWHGPEDRYVARTMKKAVEYLENADRTKQFYLWIDSFDPHEPWNPPSVYMNEPCPYNPDFKGKDQFLPLMCPVKDVYTEEELHHIRMLYAELVTLCDAWFGYLLDNIRRLGLEESTLVMQVSDHGEPMGNAEHGHGIMRKCRPWPYEELAHTPLIIRGPGIKPGQRIKTFVQSCDVAPTVCDWLGIGVQPWMQGKSLLPVLRGETDKVRDWAIAGYHGFSQALFTEEWSYIHWFQKGDDKKTGEVNYNIYGKGIYDAMGDVSTGTKSSVVTRPANSEVEREYQEAASLDGEAQWTCTPGSVAEVPKKDELYDRKNDPFQLHNVIEKHPDVARKLFTQLNDIMADLRAS